MVHAHCPCGRRPHRDGGPRRPAAEAAGSAAQRGAAFVFAILFMVLVTGLVFSGTVLMGASERSVETGFRLHAQARQFARAGLIDALAWYRRQPTQPVVSFQPVRDFTVTPSIIDTDDPDVGIVREFEIRGSLWGRYEVRKVDVRDISSHRSVPGAGMVWFLRSRGYVFRRTDSGAAFNQSPNRVLGSVSMDAEIRRMALAPPGEAAICAEQGAGVQIGANAVVAGAAGAGIFHRSGTGNPTLQAGSQVTGSPPLAPSADYDASLQAVFGVSGEELRSLADDRVTDPEAFPSPLPPLGFYFAETDLRFTASLPLRGNALVYVDGDVTLEPGSNSWFTGFLYVDGDLEVNAPASLNGTVVVTGTVHVRGAADKAEVNYDPGAVDSLRMEIGQYRLFGAFKGSGS